MALGILIHMEMALDNVTISKLDQGASTMIWYAKTRSWDEKEAFRANKAEALSVALKLGRSLAMLSGMETAL